MGTYVPAKSRTASWDTVSLAARGLYGSVCHTSTMPALRTSKHGGPHHNVGPTLDYCKRAVPYVCKTYGGDPGAVILAGFSRGAIACNCLGLNDDEIARLWLAFIPFSCYDVIRKTPNWASAPQRLERLNGRAQFICSEKRDALAETEEYIKSSGIRAPITFMHTGFRNHNDAWTLRPSPARAAMRRWLAQVIRDRPTSS